MPDIFISYKGTDRPWAARLSQELRNIGVTTFFDRDNLIGGQSWRAQLEQALTESRALVVLWSREAAQLNTWTDQERFLFQRDEVQNARLRTRPVVFVLLDTEPDALNMIQHVIELKPFHADITTVPANVWRTVAEKVKRASFPGAVIKTLVLAARQNELTPANLGDLWNYLQDLAARFGSVDATAAAGFDLNAFIASRYGATPEEWRPYGGASIRDMLGAITTEARNMQGLELAFDPAPTEIWGPDLAIAKQAGLMLARDPALIVIDPISLCLSRIIRVKPFLAPCMRSPRTAFAVLAPYSQADELLNFYVQAQMADLYRQFFWPMIPLSDDEPNIAMHVRTPLDLLRVSILTIARNARGARPRAPGSELLEWT